MTTPAAPSDRNALRQQLVQELLEMRDALITLSLCLKDWQFEVDQHARQTAQQQAEAVLGAMRLRATPGDPSGKRLSP